MPHPSPCCFRFPGMKNEFCPCFVRASLSTRQDLFHFYLRIIYYTFVGPLNPPIQQLTIKTTQLTVDIICFSFLLVSFFQFLLLFSVFSFIHLLFAHFKFLHFKKFSFYFSFCSDFGFGLSYFCMAHI